MKYHICCKISKTQRRKRSKINYEEAVKRNRRNWAIAREERFLKTGKRTRKKIFKAQQAGVLGSTRIIRKKQEDKTLFS